MNVFITAQLCPFSRVSDTDRTFLFISIIGLLEQRYFVNDTIIGRGNFYDDKGNLELVQFYENGEIVAASEILLDDGKFYPSSASWSTFLTELITPENGKDHAVIFNSWTNIIDKTVATIAVILLIVNVIFFIKKKIA